MYDMKSDVDARVMNYFHLCNTIVKNNGMATLFSDNDGMKKKCEILLNCLPEELKMRVKNEIDFRLSAAKSSVSTLFKAVIEKQLEIDREDKSVQRNKERPAVQKPTKLIEVRTSKRAKPAHRQALKAGVGPVEGHKQVDCPESMTTTRQPYASQKRGRNVKLKIINDCLPELAGKSRVLRVGGLVDNIVLIPELKFRVLFYDTKKDW
ncbi:LOW QUALITY PROTEIN: Hypothetical protein PHPALM_81 [Phytophthora palmivora]|uniref:Uncharacterized protein n=1 Tax=Phytophthora palmivora TaxID=4796 RepID=A0A2P4YVP4_9STRA|nr:LOW QUALITY PROTEIN: Hypothetical protein PHPALM_81 [Phytophthora palmivora]